MQEEGIRIGLIGAGRIGALHAGLISTRVPGARIIAVSDVVADAAHAVATEHAIPVVEDDATRVIGRNDVDAVLICSATSVHEEQVVAAAKAGKAVFCEKPLAFDLPSIDRMAEAVEKHNVPLQVGFNRRFDPVFSRVQRGIANGEVGELHTLRIISRDPEPPPIEYVRNSGGLFVDMTIHDFDMVRFLTGAEVEEVYTVADCRVDPAIDEVGDVDTAIIMLRFTNRVMATIENSRRATFGYDQRVEAFGSEGAISTDNVYPNTATVSTGESVRRDLPLHFFLERYTDSYVAELSAFVYAVAQGHPTPVSVFDGRAPLVLGEAAHRSHREKRPVRLEEIDA